MLCLLVWQAPLAALAQNAIITENARSTASDAPWKFNEINNPTGLGITPQIQGFATDISYQPGDMVCLKIKATNASDYRVDIFRLGFYGGVGAKQQLPAPTLTTTPQCQSPTSLNPCACITNSSTGLLDCGNWDVSAQWRVPQLAVSGVYVAKLTFTAGNFLGQGNYIVFIVRNDASTSDLFFQTSDATWQAYNTYGDANNGRSLYRKNPDNPDIDVKAVKVSYNRPFYNGIDQSENDVNWIFGAEYPMIRWLEANGFDVSYTTNVDTERRGNLIQNHKVFLSVGHDEYWSKGMRQNVTAARDAGKNLAFFSGNEVYWKTRWADGEAGPCQTIDHRTMICYKEGTMGDTPCAGNSAPCTDPTSEWTGTWRDGCREKPMDACFAENELTGTLGWILTDTVNNTLAPLPLPVKVPNKYHNLRFWRHTPFFGNTTGTAVLGSDILGYEWDPEMRMDSESYPNGRMLLSETTSGNPLVQDVRVHHMSLYKHTSGAWVFGAGTLQWTWGLDDYHTRRKIQSNENASIKQATVNLLVDMGVSAYIPVACVGCPQTTATGQVVTGPSTDTQAPTVTVTPLSSTLLPSGKTVQITGAATDNVTVAGVELSTDGGIRWRPATLTNAATWTFDWTPTPQGAQTIKCRAFDDSGNMSPVVSIAVMVTLPAGECTLFRSTDAPDDSPFGNSSLIRDVPEGPITVGMRFVSSVTGAVTGVRFYRPAPLSGDSNDKCVGLLFDDANPTTPLRKVVFAPATTVGWQQATFDRPVYIAANKVYVVAYHSPLGYYTASRPAFVQAKPKASGPLRAIVDNESNGNNGTYRNGLYLYTTNSEAFPSMEHNASNYWVDVTFVPTPHTVFPPLVAPTGPLMNGGPTNPLQVGMKFSSVVEGNITGVRFYKQPGNNGTHTGYLYASYVPGGANNPLRMVTFGPETPSGWQQAFFSSPYKIAANTTYVVAYYSPEGTYSATPQGFNGAVYNTPLTGLASPSSGGNGVYKYCPTAPCLATNRTCPNDTYDATNYWVDAIFSPVVSNTLFANTTAVAGSSQVTDSNTNNAGITVGMKFKTDVPGKVTGVRFYNLPTNNGGASYTAKLYNAAGGSPLSQTSANFVGSPGPGPGWQTIYFNSPVAITHTDTYVVAYHSPDCRYYLTRPGFANAIRNVPITGLTDAASGGNGVYVYANSFPNSSYQASNYWVDVLFQRDDAYRPLSATNGANAQQGLHLNAYPNPFADQLTVELSNAAAGNSALTMYDIQGRVVLTTSQGQLRAGETKQLTISTATLAQGIYMVKWFSGDEAVYSKVVLMR